MQNSLIHHMIISLDILKLLSIFLPIFQWFFLFDFLFLFNAFDNNFLGLVLKILFLSIWICFYDQLVLFQSFLAIFDKRAPHVKFSVTDLATETCWALWLVKNYEVWMEIPIVSIEPPLLMHTGFACSRTAKITELYFWATDIFLAWNTVIWSNFGAHFLGELENIIILVKIHGKFLINFDFIPNVLVFIFIKNLLEIIINTWVHFWHL